jgi:hypothetical protein
MLLAEVGDCASLENHCIRAEGDFDKRYSENNQVPLYELSCHRAQDTSLAVTTPAFHAAFTRPPVTERPQLSQTPRCSAPIPHRVFPKMPELCGNLP